MEGLGRQQENKENIKTGYLKTIQDGGFYSLSVEDPGDSFFRMFDRKGNTAKYEFSRDVRVALANADTIKEITTTSGVSSREATNIENIEPGIIELQEDKSWKIIKKAKIKFVNKFSEKETSGDLGVSDKERDKARREANEKEHKERIEKLISTSNILPIKGERIYLKEREGNVLFKESKDEENGFYVLFNFQGNRASYRFCGNEARALSNYDAVLKKMFDSNNTSAQGAKYITNIKDGIVEKGADGKWKVIEYAGIVYTVEKPKVKVGESVVEDTNDVEKNNQETTESDQQNSLVVEKKEPEVIKLQTEDTKIEQQGIQEPQEPEIAPEEISSETEFVTPEDINNEENNSNLSDKENNIDNKEYKRNQKIGELSDSIFRRRILELSIKDNLSEEERDKIFNEIKEEEDLENDLIKDLESLGVSNEELEAFKEKIKPNSISEEKEDNDEDKTKQEKTNKKKEKKKGNEEKEWYTKYESNSNDNENDKNNEKELNYKESKYMKPFKWDIFKANNQYHKEKRNLSKIEKEISRLQKEEKRLALLAAKIQSDIDDLSRRSSRTPEEDRHLIENNNLLSDTNSKISEIKTQLNNLSTVDLPSIQAEIDNKKRERTLKEQTRDNQEKLDSVGSLRKKIERSIYRVTTRPFMERLSNKAKIATLAAAISASYILSGHIGEGKENTSKEDKSKPKTEDTRPIPPKTVDTPKKEKEHKKKTGKTPDYIPIKVRGDMNAPKPIIVNSEQTNTENNNTKWVDPGVDIKMQDGTIRHFSSLKEAANELGIPEEKFHKDN